MLAGEMLGLGLAEAVAGEGLTSHSLSLGALTSCHESPRAASMGCSELRWQSGQLHLEGGGKSLWCLCWDPHRELFNLIMEHYKAPGHFYLPTHWLQVQGRSMATAQPPLSSQLSITAINRS